MVVTDVNLESHSIATLRLSVVQVLHVVPLLDSTAGCSLATATNAGF